MQYAGHETQDGGASAANVGGKVHQYRSLFTFIPLTVEIVKHVGLLLDCVFY